MDVFKSVAKFTCRHALYRLLNIQMFAWVWMNCLGLLRASMTVEGLRTGVVYPVPRTVCAQSIQRVLCLMYTKTWAKVLHVTASQFLSFIHGYLQLDTCTCNKLPNSISTYVKFQNKLFPRNPTGSQSLNLTYMPGWCFVHCWLLEGKVTRQV